MADNYVAGAYTFSSKEAGSVHRPSTVGLWLDGSTFREVSKAYPQPVQRVDSAGNPMEGALSDSAWDLAAASPSKQAIDKKQALLLEDIRAGVTNSSAVSLVNPLQMANRTQMVMLSLVNFEITQATEMLATLTINAGLSGASTGTDYTVTSSRRLRITAIGGHLTMKTGTSAGGPPILVSIRASSSGAITTSSVRPFAFGMQASGAANGVNVMQPVAIGDSWELAASNRIGVSLLYTGWVTTTSVPLITLHIIGYEYQP